ncbi:MAG: glycine zipper domain-containing protein [Candidatus Omnitrophota bacterium]
MKSRFFLALSAAGLIICGCVSNKTRTAEGAFIGGALGAAAGGIIGHQSGHGTEGALIGAVTGAAAGAATGSMVEKQQAEPSADQPVPQERQVSPGQPAAVMNPSANPNQIPASRIVEMAKQGVDEKVIIDKILLSGSRYALTDAEISSLEAQGVSRPVIDTMLRD